MQRRSSRGPTDFSYQIRKDSETDFTEFATATIPVGTTTLMSTQVDFPAATQVTSTATIRIYGFGAQTSSGTYRYGGVISLNGSQP
mmetsp:Transcript_11247/g.12368  ORF Transcript_11247/g.12368 Transcript_11247/m.12368 type:complete len:86 (-) Transcript_11247:29-286(-)